MLPEYKIPEDMDQKTLLKVIERVHFHTGITINQQKKTMLQSRLKKRMKKIGLESYDEYMMLLNSDKSEIEHFINAVTTNETSFFRTPRIWDYFQKSFLPEWFAENPKKQLRIWSAAASSGEEAFSLAICCQDFQNRNQGFDYVIYATDISTEVLSDAQKGVYSMRSVEFLKKSKPHIFDLYFTSVENETFAISPKLKMKVHFGVHNLFTIKKEQYHIAFLRNVLIYFSGDDQVKVLTNVSKSLEDTKGILIIGESESLNRLDVPYDFKEACIYNKKAAAKV
ncbi:MAG: protein-glutamate O-methyltransferase CheR [Bdellovibrionales bacterium]|nr:protein-glutamate O-methyltransferase CheR [Bdellovibrionales bacterium]